MKLVHVIMIDGKAVVAYLDKKDADERLSELQQIEREKVQRLQFGVFERAEHKYHLETIALFEEKDVNHGME